MPRRPCLLRYCYYWYFSSREADEPPKNPCSRPYHEITTASFDIYQNLTVGGWAYREYNTDLKPAPYRLKQLDLSAMTLCDGLHDRQTQTRPRTAATPIKSVKDTLAFLRRNSGPIIDYLDVGQASIQSVTDVDTPAFRNVMKGIGNQISEQYT